MKSSSYLKYGGALAVFLLAFVAVTATLPSFGVTFDEFNYFYSSDLEFEWMTKLVEGLKAGKIGEVLSDQTIQRYWNWKPFTICHPPVSRVLSGITKTLFNPIVDLFVAYRLSVVILFSLLGSLLFIWVNEIYGWSSALISGLLWILMPHVFGHAHIASADMPLTFFWLASTYAFIKGQGKWYWSIIFALFLGLAFSTKFPGFFIPIPLMVWAFWYRKKDCFRNLAAMVIISPLVMLATQPYLWHNPLGRLLDFFHQSLTRLQHFGAQIPTYFFHQQLLGDQLPFYYPFFILIISIPILVLLLLLAGSCFKAKDTYQKEINSLMWIHFIFILLVPVLPGAFIHDGVRLLLPAFPFVAFLAGAGFYFLKEWIVSFFEKTTRQEKVSLITGFLKSLSAFFEKKGLPFERWERKVVPWGVAVLILLPLTWEMIDIHPNQLMYYNCLVGGVNGAYRMGLETTYLGEAFNEDFYRFLNHTLPPGAAINASFSTMNFWQYQIRGVLRKDLKFSLLDFDYYILLCRRGYLYGFDQWIFDNKTPVIVKKFKDVPLIHIYHFKKQDRFWKENK